jgi:hypothetical protein
MVVQRFAPVVAPKHVCSQCFFAPQLEQIFLRILRHSVLARLPAQNILTPPPTLCFGASSGAKYSCASSDTVFWRVFRRKIFLRLLRHSTLASCASSITVFWRVYGRKIFLRVLRHV